jgi:protein TonB
VAVRPRRVEVRVVEPPPAPEIEPPKVPEPPTPKAPPPPPPKIVEATRQPPRAPARPAVSTAPPVTTSAAVTTTTTTGDAPAQPVFGVTMESTSSAGTGPAVPIGNSGSAAAPRGPVQPGAGAPGAPAPAHEVTKMPLPLGRCSGAYTEAARSAGVEGVVVLDLVVDEQGRARDIVVVAGLPHGLTEAAITALATCRFTPGERAGAAVAVRLRAFKIRFVLDS